MVVTGQGRDSCSVFKFISMLNWSKGKAVEVNVATNFYGSGLPKRSECPNNVAFHVVRIAEKTSGFATCVKLSERV